MLLTQNTKYSFLKMNSVVERRLFRYKPIIFAYQELNRNEIKRYNMVVLLEKRHNQ